MQGSPIRRFVRRRRLNLGNSAWNNELSREKSIQGKRGKSTVWFLIFGREESDESLDLHESCEMSFMCFVVVYVWWQLAWKTSPKESPFYKRYSKAK